MPTIWILGNWKQNLLREAAGQCAAAVAADLGDALGDAASDAVRVGIAPPYLSIHAAVEHCQPATPLWLLAQDCGAQDSGAFTGEVGPAMLKDAGVGATIIGHSERRAGFGDDDTVVAAKLNAALSGGLTVVLCVGEGLESRDAGEHESTVISQLSGAFSDLESRSGIAAISERLVVAYEPVWAIGTGRTATPDQASAMHATIRAWMAERFGDAGRDRSILYGGSVKPGNAAELIAAPDVDGFLVGGASLDPSSFLAIVRAAAQPAH